MPQDPIDADFSLLQLQVLCRHASHNSQLSEPVSIKNSNVNLHF